MTTEDKTFLPIPGSEVVGRGIYLRPRQPYGLKSLLFKQDKGNRTYYSKETGQTYYVPLGYEINDSPPMPAKQSLNQVTIEESWERLDKQLNLDANLAVGNGVFSIDANAAQSAQLRSEEEAYYALRSSFIPLWTIYLPDTRGISQDMFDQDVPTPFRHAHRDDYERFFDCYGTHYVKRVWVGGKAMLAFTVVKSSQMTKEDIQAGIKASYMGSGSGGASMALKNSKEKLQNHSECTVFGKGGDELKLASLSSLDETRYNEWLATIKDNPQVIEIEVAGIWTLISDREKAKALMEAYKEATTFTTISAIFSIGKLVYFLRGNKYFCYDVEKCESEKPRPISEKWPALSEAGFDRPDAAMRGEYLFSKEGESLNRKVFFFKRDSFVRLDLDSGEIDKGYPMKIAEGWPGVTFERVDSVLTTDPDSVYFFSGSNYIRYDTLQNRAGEGYPEPISKRWTGLTFDRIDASTYWGNGKVYFFRGDHHIRYDTVVYRADPGYPKFISGSYVEDWKFFE